MSELPEQAIWTKQGGGPGTRASIWIFISQSREVAKIFLKNDFFFNNICELFWRVIINIAKVERLLDYNKRHFLSKFLFLFILPTKITHLFLAAVLALLDKTCQQQDSTWDFRPAMFCIDLLFWGIPTDGVPPYIWLKISSALKQEPDICLWKARVGWAWSHNWVGPAKKNIFIVIYIQKGLSY